MLRTQIIRTGDPGGIVCCQGEQNCHRRFGVAQGMAQLFQPMGDIHAVADDGIIHALGRANIADNDRTRVNADSQPQGCAWLGFIAVFHRRTNRQAVRQARAA